MYVARNATIKKLFTYFALTFFLVTPAAFLTPLLVTRSFGSEVWRLTANEVTFFGGSILGGLIMTFWGVTLDCFPCPRQNHPNRRLRHFVPGL